MSLLVLFSKWCLHFTKAQCFDYNDPIYIARCRGIFSCWTPKRLFNKKWNSNLFNTKRKDTSIIYERLTSLNVKSTWNDIPTHNFEHFYANNYPKLVHISWIGFVNDKKKMAASDRMSVEVGVNRRKMNFPSSLHISLKNWLRLNWDAGLKDDSTASVIWYSMKTISLNSTAFNKLPPNCVGRVGSPSRVSQFEGMDYDFPNGIWQTNHFYPHLALTYGVPFPFQPFTHTTSTGMKDFQATKVIAFVETNEKCIKFHFQA